MLTHIEFENYRIFKKRQAIDIKPITLLFGKNNAGKSAVLKLPMLALSIQYSGYSDNFNTTYNGVRICDTYLTIAASVSDIDMIAIPDGRSALIGHLNVFKV